LFEVVEQCKKEGSENGVYLYHVANMVDPEAGAELIKVTNTVYLYHVANMVDPETDTELLRVSK